MVTGHIPDNVPLQAELDCRDFSPLWVGCLTGDRRNHGADRSVPQSPWGQVPGGGSRCRWPRTGRQGAGVSIRWLMEPALSQRIGPAPPAHTPKLLADALFAVAPGKEGSRTSLNRDNRVDEFV